MSLQDRVAWLVGKPLFWILFIGIAIALNVVRGILSPKLPPLPDALGVVEPFRLTDHRGRPFGTPELTGAIWVAGLTCTKCPNVDPIATKRLGEAQHRSRNLGSKFHVVAITTEPEQDSSEVLSEFALKNHASARRWAFLTGEREAVKKLVTSLYARDPMQALDVGKAEVIGPGANHRLVLVDQATQIRGYYDARRDEEIDRLMRDAGLLANLRFRSAPPVETSTKAE
jgi:protein SCO1